MTTLIGVLGLALLFVAFALVGRLTGRTSGCGTCSNQKPKCGACPTPDTNSESKHVSN